MGLWCHDDLGSVAVATGGGAVVIKGRNHLPGPGAHSFGDEERAEVLEVLESGHLSRFGDLADPAFKHKVYDLEREFAAYCGAAHALATNSGTSSLLLALHALGIGEGDEVLVPGFTYVATYGAVIHARATPVLVEIDDSLTIDPVDLEQKVTSRSKAVIVVHMLGNPCDMAAVTDIASRHGLRIIEDACQAAGASYRGQKVGSFGDVGAFSFNRYKMMSAGEGGILTSSDDALYERSFALHDQGHAPLRAAKRQSDGVVIGLNMKMNELTGAVALAQLRKLDAMLKKLRDNKRALRAMLPEVRGVKPARLNDPDGECATFLTSIFDDPLHAASVARSLGVATLSETGWHNYQLMDHIRHHRTARPAWSGRARFADAGALPRTDDYLARAVNMSIGVVDNGLGSGFGININSSYDELQSAAAQFISAVRANHD
jgi:dTDP-4-amino-4,6-dideoxygalactose transaminase